MGANPIAVITFTVSGKRLTVNLSNNKFRNFTNPERSDEGEDGITISPNQQGYIVLTLTER